MLSLLLRTVPTMRGSLHLSGEQAADPSRPHLDARELGSACATVCADGRRP